MNTDFLIHEMANTYHGKRGEYLSSHLLGDFLENPKYYKQKVDGQVKDVDQTAYIEGRAVHTRILEGQQIFNDTYIIGGGPINKTTGKPYGTDSKAYKEWASEQTKELLTETQGELVKSLNETASQHSEAMDLLSVGVAEGVVRCEYMQIKCQIRIDWFNPEKGIVDLKTCKDLSWFESDAKRYNYPHQLAFYRSVLKSHTSIEFPVYMIAVEKKAPYRCGVWEVTREVLGIAQKENERAIERLIACRKTGEYKDGYETIRKFDLIK